MKYHFEFLIGVFLSGMAILLLFQCTLDGETEVVYYALDLKFDDVNLAKCVQATEESSVDEIIGLNCRQMDIKSIAGIEQLENLETIDLTSNPVRDISPLANLKRLESANLDSTDVSNLDTLAPNQKLTALSLSGTHPDWQSLQKMKQLRQLTVRDCEIENLTDIRKMTWLVALDISNNPITEYGDLDNLENLNTLSVAGNNIESPLFLQSLKNLEVLDISDNNISEVDGLVELEKLRALDLSGNETADITPLSLLKNLRELNMGRNRVRWGVYTLSWLVDMEQVDLADNDSIPCDDLDKLRNALGEEAVVGVTTCVENPTVDYCGQEIPLKDHMDILNHTFMIRSIYSKNTEVQGLLFAKFVLEMILNGINISTVKDYKLHFENNQYRWGKENDYLFFTFVFTQDYGNFKAGDTIPYDLTELKTYIPGFKVKAPDIKISNPLKSELPSLDITEKGPLFELVDYHVDWNGLIPNFRFTYPNLGTIGVSMGTHGFYTRAYPDTLITDGIPKIKTITDTLAVHFFTPMRTLRSFKDVVDSGRLEIKFDETEYKSNMFKIHQTVPASSIMLNFSKDTWTFDGTYQSTITQKRGAFYTESVFSNIQTNREVLYCDEDRTTKLGEARNHQFLPFGVYTAANGGKFYYILIPF